MPRPTPLTRIATFLVLAVAVAALTAGCSNDCVACADVPTGQTVPTAKVDVRLCMSAIPNPQEANRTCDRLAVTVEGATP